MTKTLAHLVALLLAASLTGCPASRLETDDAQMHSADVGSAMDASDAGRMADTRNRPPETAEQSAPPDLAAADLVSADLAADLSQPGELRTIPDAVPEVADIAPAPDLSAETLGEDAAHPGSGVYGTLMVTKGNCMPPSPPDCAQILFPSADLFFIEINSEASFWTTSSDVGVYEISLPAGEYYVWPDVGWNQGTLSLDCLKDLAHCTPDEYSFFKGDFEYMEGQGKCNSDALWESHDRCNVVITGETFKLDISIDNVAY